MTQYRFETKPNEMPQNTSFYDNLLIKTPQPSKEEIGKLQQRLLQTFPFPVSTNFQVNKLKVKNKSHFVKML